MLVGALVLAAGCSRGQSPAQQLQNDTATVLDKANAKDVDGVHNAAAVMKSDIRSLNARNMLGTSKAQELLKTLNAIEAEAETLTAKPSGPPTPTDSTDSPTPSPTASPTPSPTASPTPSPTASPTPSPTASPTPSATVTSSPTRSAAAVVVPRLGKKKKHGH